LEDRENLSAANARFRGTIHGAAELNQWATTAQWLAANPDATDEQLLAEFRPGLLRIGWAERRQAMVDYLRDAPRLYNEARANLDRYDAMPAASTAAEFLALGRGELYAAATSYDALIGGGGVRGATWLLRALKTVLREAGTAAVTDSIKQWQNIEAGLQTKFDGWRTAVSAGVAGLFGAASNAGTDLVQLGIKGKAGPPGGKAPTADRPISAAKIAQTEFDARIAKVEKDAAEKPVSGKYINAEPGKGGGNDYARTFHQVHGRKGDVEVHHAIEQNVLEWYPKLFRPDEIHSLQNLRGIPNDLKNTLHRSIIRKAWNEFHAANKAPTRQEVINFATSIDRRYGGLFDPPL
jgi:hypothetical protein